MGMEDKAQRANIFNEQGRVLQTENAIKYVANAGSSMSIVSDDGILILGHNKTKEDESLEKIVKIDRNIYAIFSGIYADALQLINLMRIEAQNYLMKYDSLIPISVLIMKISQRLQYFTQKGGQRPMGCSFLLSTYEDNEYQIYSLDPSGNFNRWERKAFGKHDEKFNSIFRTNEEINSNLKNVTQEIFKTIKKVIECPKSDAKKFEVVHFTKTEKKILSLKEIEDLIEIN